MKACRVQRYASSLLFEIFVESAELFVMTFEKPDFSWRQTVNTTPELGALIEAKAAAEARSLGNTMHVIFRDYFAGQGAPAVAERQADYGARAGEMLQREQIADERRRKEKRRPKRAAVEGTGP